MSAARAQTHCELPQRSTALVQVGRRAKTTPVFAVTRHWKVAESDDAPFLRARLGFWGASW
jgi:hypothetical protein